MMIVNTQDAGYSATKQSTQEYVVPFDLSKPVYPDTIQIHVSELDFSSKATTRKAFKQDEVICNIKGITDGVKRWTSVQFGRNRHIELNSELVYMNHSCEPSVKLDCEKQQIIAMKELKVGDELCFFYPSTEWDMSQPFDCWCESSLCLKTISGAKNIPKSKLNNFHFTKHIVDLLKERDQLNYYKPYSGAPVYPDLIKVEESLQDFSSKAVTLKKFTAGEKVCDIVGITEGFKVWTSVQFGENRHIELNSELVYMNHSCDPSIRIDPEEQAIYALKDLNVNDELSFFYPSTEWEMSQPFDCWCHSTNCLKNINGSKSIPASLRTKFYFAPHIERLFDDRDGIYRKPFTGRPVYEDLISIHINEKEFSSKATIKKEFKKDQIICEIKGITESIKRWTSVQFGANRHIELNSELVYMNHSCDPSVKIDPESKQIIALKDLKVGDEITFFYPSTEWDMSQGFDCWCGATTCLKSIRGAKHVPESKISKFYFAPHILELLNERQL